MPVFIDPAANRVALINLKAMFSTFRAHPAYQLVTPAQAVRFVLRRSMLGKRPPMLMIVRNPYERLVSCFNDKFRKIPAERSGWQDIHLVLFPQLGLAPDDADEVVRERLLGTGFAEFIEMLPKAYRTDAHTRPQSDLLQKFPGIDPRWWLKRISLARMEKLDAVELRQQWGIDVAIRQNFTGRSGNYTEYFTPRCFAIANKLYALDFELFGYPVQE